MDGFQAPPGYHWVFCLCFKHWRSGQMVYRKNGGYFRFLVKGRARRERGGREPPSLPPFNFDASSSIFFFLEDPWPKFL
jgi:hypothetical protein